MIRLSQIKLSLNEDKSALNKKLAKTLRVPVQDIIKYRIYKESIDARKGQIKKVYTIDVALKNEEKLLSKNKNLKKAPDLEYKNVKPGQAALNGRPVVVGFGPAGMFAALLLSEMGYKPIVVERGQDVDERTQAVNTFWESGKLSEESNVQFGEGGAGTFSDGKLTTRIKDLRCRKVLEALVQAGAPEEILYKNKPHIGTDKLKPTVKNIRKAIEAKGGEIRFNTRLDDIVIENDRVVGLVLSNGQILTTNAIVLAIGHSSRDTFEMLKNRKVPMQAKPFAVGVRIEHPQDMIDQVQYSSEERPEGLGAAEYKLTHQTESGRGVYTFCMCPGGLVVASSSEKNSLVVNGMSEYARDKQNANSALLVSVTPDDFPSEDPLSGVTFQRELERKAFEVAGADYRAPIQRVDDFLKGSVTKVERLGDIHPSYTPGVVGVNMQEIFPDFIIEALREGILAMDKKLKGFARGDAVLTAVESRSSSPIRIHRNEESLESTVVGGLYPCGEGAGYAGGIMSSAVDGIKVAEQIIMKYGQSTL